MVGDCEESLRRQPHSLSSHGEFGSLEAVLQQFHQAARADLDQLIAHFIDRVARFVQSEVLVGNRGKVIGDGSTSPSRSSTSAAKS